MTEAAALSSDAQPEMATPKEMANAIRALSMDAVQAANSGHPGMPMGMAHRDVRQILRPTLPHPDYAPILKTMGDSHLNLELTRYEGKPVDVLEIDGEITDKQAERIEERLWKLNNNICKIPLYRPSAGFCRYYYPVPQHAQAIGRG